MSFSGFKTKTVVTALTAVLATSAFGYWGYGELREQALRNEIIELVKDTSLHMATALGTEAPQKSAASLAALRKFYEHAEAVAGHFQKLNAMDLASPVADLADAADDYMLTSREILLRRASSQRYRLKLSGSIQALHAHMRADNRTGAWVSEAIRAKEKVEEDYRDYRLAINALGSLLGTFPASRAKMALYIDATLLTNEALVEEARRQALEASTRAADEIEKVRQLHAYR